MWLLDNIDTTNIQPSQNVFLEQVLWKLEAVWVLKACFQVSLGYESVAGFQGILPWEKKFQNFNDQGCNDRASDRMQWYRFTQVANICILRIIRACLCIKQKVVPHQQQSSCLTTPQAKIFNWLFWLFLLYSRSVHLEGVLINFVNCRNLSA